MENILDVYAQEPDPENPRICFDERPILLVDDCVEPLPMQKGKAKRMDYEYKRGEAVVALLAYNMDTGQRHVQITKTKKKQDYAQFIAWVMDTYYKNTRSIQLIQDNLNTHTKGSFYLNTSPQQARQYTKKLHFHFTPKHGSWLNMAEIEFSALARQCLNRRFDSVNTLVKEVKAWEVERNQKAVKIHWSFTIDKAQEKLARHYCNVFNNY
jgi:DDE superfamily endonuclease